MRGSEEGSNIREGETTGSIVSTEEYGGRISRCIAVLRSRSSSERSVRGLSDSLSEKEIDRV